MEFYLLKFIEFFLSPLSIIFIFSLIFFILIIFSNCSILIKNVAKILIVIYLTFFYLPLSDLILSKIEDFIKPSNYPVAQLKGVVIMGGEGNLLDEIISKERNQLKSNNRLDKGLEIYNKNPKLLILFTGNSYTKYLNGWSESEQAKRYFINKGVRSENLIIENQSKNTYQNVLNSKILLDNRGNWGLITSAAHMPRAYYTFAKQNLILEPIPINYQTGKNRLAPTDIFNLERSLSNWEIIVHESFGLIYYKLSNKL